MMGGLGLASCFQWVVGPRFCWEWTFVARHLGHVMVSRMSEVDWRTRMGH